MSVETEHHFDLAGPVPEGITVLEASAGTGKTFTIAALAARFIAEGTPLDQVLLVTFTRTATSELRERVRERLVSTERGLAAALHGSSIDDPVVRLLAGGSPVDVEARRARLADAISNFDEATIETTHGFCQQVLDQLGTLGDLEPDITFVENIDDLVQEVVDDLYVRRFYRERDGRRLTFKEAKAIGRLAVENPTAPLHPLQADEGSDAAMRVRLASAVRGELERRKRSLALMTHDDQLTRLLASLTGTGAEGAIAQLRGRFRVVLIDEFQDTDPIQWDIVRIAFGGGGVRLVLIGDPKQAIYAFRGADVYAYLQAASEAVRRATLDVNHRSDQGLLDGLDALFGGARLGHPAIVYRQVSAAPGNRAGRLHDAPSAVPVRLRIVDKDSPEITLTPGGWASAPSVREYIARDLAGEIVELLSSNARIEQRDPSGETRGFKPVGPGDIAVLVYSHRQAALIQRALARVEVPVVINGAGSVFATDAADDWRALLEALERPASPTRARRAALTPILGWSAKRLALADESELEQLHSRLYGWARTLREHGVAALSRSLLATEHTAARMLRTDDGERYLTDLEHVAQLLHAAAGAQDLGVAALTGWLRQRVADAASEGGNDELTRRLDSDADAVQVLTFHRSKGLEFPIVHCPFLWEPGRLSDSGEPIYFHDADGGYIRALDVGLEGAEYRRHFEQHCIEERGEELRLAYVGLTRARHQAVIWWAGTYAARDSPLGRLLFARDDDGNVAWHGTSRPSPDTVLERLAAVAELAPHSVGVEQVVTRGLEAWRPPSEREAEMRVAEFTRPLDLSWRRSSYSAITAAAHESLSGVAVGSEPEDEERADEPSGPLEGLAAVALADGAGAPGDVGGVGGVRALSGSGVDAELRELRLPLEPMAMGPRVGTVIHRVLELVDFSVPDLDQVMGAAVENAVARSPSLLGCPAEVVGGGLAAALQTPLGGSLGGLALADVERRDRLDELEFELPLAGGENPRGRVALDAVAGVLERHLHDDDPLFGYAKRLRDPSLVGVLRGYLTGVIDLVLRVTDVSLLSQRPRFYVIDYKTNWLAGPDQQLSAWHYRPEALAAEMQRSHYVLQALLYSVALHRYLRWRLPDYEPDTDLGGIRYLFVRGMVGESTPVTDGGRCGVFSWEPPPRLVPELSEVLDGH